MSNIDTVKAMYEAFGRGDVAAILDKLDENVEWDTDYKQAAAPWLEPRRGKANIGGFFEALSVLTFTKFDPHTIAETGNRVIAVIDIEADHKGKHYVIPNEGHLWTFGADGKVTSYQHMTDTALHWRMANGQ
jgi:ketosteroid isomerase-like protein